VSGPLVRVLRLLLPERRRVAGAVLLQVSTIASGVALMGSSAWLLSKAALHPSIAALQVAIVGVRAFGVARATLRYLERLVSHDVALRLLARLRSMLFRALVPLAPAGLADRRCGDLVARALEDTGTLETLYARLVGPSLAAVAIAGLVAALVLPFGVALAAAATCGLVLGGGLAPGLAARLGEAPGRRLVAGRGVLSARLVDGVRGVADLLAAGREGDHARILAATGLGVAAEQARLVRASALGGALVTLAADLTTLAVLTLGIRAVAAGELDGVALASVALVSLAAFEAVAPLPQAWQGLGSMREAARRIVEVVDAAPAVVEPGGPSPAPVADAPLVEVRELRFGYPGASRPALDGVSLRLERGRRVAVVGASGSGKSTLAALLLRFWPAPAGSIRLEGHDLAAWPSDAARERFACSAQRAHVFTGTLRENLLLARKDASDAELLEVLRALRLDALLERLPRGLDGWLGAEGLQLSGGERQRLAVARALLRPAPILLLDEPTAHLDSLTEREVLHAILRAGAERATLVVTHRLAGLEAFDEVVVLERGRVVERGRAAELRARAGPFSRLLALQRAVDALEPGGSGSAGARSRPSGR
jgi:thiol reductant ABC exporter CydC subunit